MGYSLSYKLNKIQVKLLVIIFCLSALLSIYWILFQKIQLLYAWYLFLTLLLPPLILIQRTRYISAKVFVWTAFLTQAFTMPIFFSFPDNYHFQHHREFLFTGWEVIGVYWRLSLLLLLFCFCVAIIERSSLPIFRYRIRSQINEPSSLSGYLKNLNSKSIFYSASIVILILIMVPVNGWMFKMGIGLTGIEPPRLPYRMSGILTYLAKWIVPGVIAYLYFNTRQKSFLLLMILGLYSVYLGISTASRAAALSILFTPLALSIVNRRWLLGVLALIFTLLSIGLTTASRKIVFFASEGHTKGFTDLGLLETLYQACDLLDFTAVLLVLPKIFARISGFEGLFLSTHIEPSSFGGSFAVWLKTLNWKYSVLGHEQVHQQFLGYVPPIGFYNATADVYAYAIWAGNGNILYYGLFSLTAALYLIMQESALLRIGNKYQSIEIYCRSLCILLSIFYVAAIGSPRFFNIFILLVVFSLLPKMVIKKNIRKFDNHSK